MKKSQRSARPQFALSYVNPTIDHRANGSLSAREFFELKPVPEPTRQIDLESLRAGGVRLAVLSHANNDPELLPGVKGFEYLVRVFTALRSAIDERSRHCKLVQTKSDLGGGDDRLRIILHLTGAPINGYLQNLESFFYLGVRAIHPFVNQAEIGGYTGCGDPAMGITPFGRDVVRLAQQLKMVIDVAHTNDRAFRDVLRLCHGPVINSHTGCRKLPNSNPNRCCTDAQLKAVAATGGVVGVHFGSSFLWQAPPQAVHARQTAMERMRNEDRKLKAKYRDPYEYLSHRLDPGRWEEVLGGSVRNDPVFRAPLENLVDHLMYMLEVAGEDHVALGSDYSLGDLCDGVTNVRNLPRLARALENRGVRGAALEKVLWKNWENLFRRMLPD